MATHSSILTWEIPWKEEPDGLHSMGSQRVGHNRATKQTTCVCVCVCVCVLEHLKIKNGSRFSTDTDTSGSIHVLYFLQFFFKFCKLHLYVYTYEIFKENSCSEIANKTSSFLTAFSSKPLWSPAARKGEFCDSSKSALPTKIFGYMQCVPNAMVVYFVHRSWSLLILNNPPLVSISQVVTTNLFSVSMSLFLLLHIHSFAFFFLG